MSPRVSIVTTVYDRVACLARCLRSVQQLEFTDVEQIVVSDAPPAKIVAEIARLTEQAGVRHINLPARTNNWGITPAAVGLRAAVGEYVCWLSDDNAYLPTHLGPLVDLLDRDPSLGFVYSSCLYAGRTTLDTAPPQYGRIDLGQPLFRRSVIAEHLQNDLPFAEHAWDWRLIQTLMAQGVRWQHLNVPTFIFRLEAYPQHLQAIA